jgi:hypothetical protein
VGEEVKEWCSTFSNSITYSQNPGKVPEDFLDLDEEKFLNLALRILNVRTRRGSKPESANSHGLMGRKRKARISLEAMATPK